jgi:hypothetical protein
MGFGRINRAKYRWPGGRVPFTIDRTEFPAGSPADTAIQQAITAWDATGVITMVPHTQEADYVTIGTNNAACFSDNVGRTGGQQFIFCDLPLAVIAPANAKVAICKQTSDILTALVIGNDGALWVSWVVGNNP